jgi:aldose 1-epimerase
MSVFRLLMVVVAVAHFNNDSWNCTDVAQRGGFAPYTLVSPSGGIKLTFIPYGGTVQKVIVADRRGNSVDVVLGFDDPSQYCLGEFGQAGHPYFGAVIGRIANRIRGGNFVLNSKSYNTPINEPAGNDTLHGGTSGFDRQIWDVKPINSSSAVLSYLSPDGEMGFPGSVSLSVTYTLRDNVWVIEYDAVANDQDSVVGLTQHTYWNLNGCSQNVLEHVLYIPDGTRTVSVNEHLVPTGDLENVNEAMDFRLPKPLSAGINQTTRYSWGTGYDNAYVFNNWTSGQTPTNRVSVFSAQTGIQMVVSTDQPAVQVYSGNQLSGSIPAKSDQPKGAFYQHWGALALEASNYPDAVNHMSFPSPVLRKGEHYKQTTMYSFGVLP